MTWVRLDDGFAGHPKMEAVGPLAGWLHVAALCYSAQYLTDGRVPKSKALKLGDVPKPREQIAKLLAENVWEDDGDAYLIHDYLTYQPSREKVMAERDAAARRQRKSRQRHGVTDTVTDDATHTVSHTTPSRPDPSPVASTGPDSLGFTEGDPRDPRVAAAVEALAAEDLANGQAAGRVRVAEPYLDECRRRRWHDDGKDLDAIAEEHPTADPERLIAILADRKWLT